MPLSAADADAAEAFLKSNRAHPGRTGMDSAGAGRTRAKTCKLGVVRLSWVSCGCVVRPPPTLAYSLCRVRSPQLACDVRGGSDGSGRCSRAALSDEHHGGEAPLQCNVSMFSLALATMSTAAVEVMWSVDCSKALLPRNVEAGRTTF